MAQGLFVSSSERKDLPDSAMPLWSIFIIDVRRLRISDNYIS